VIDCSTADWLAENILSVYHSLVITELFVEFGSMGHKEIDVVIDGRMELELSACFAGAAVTSYAPSSGPRSRYSLGILRLRKT